MCKGNDTDEEAVVMWTVVFRTPQNQSCSVFPRHDLQQEFKIYMQGETIQRELEPGKNSSLCKFSFIF